MRVSLNCGQGVAAALIGVCLALSPCNAQGRGPAQPRLEALIAERIQRGGAVGMAVAVIEHGRPRFVMAGSRSVTAPLPMEETTILEIGSISKVFTTILLAEMVGRGEVRLDDPVQRYLPPTVRVPERNGKAITLLDLATSTSGLPRVPALEPPDSTNPYAHFDAAQMYAYLSAYTLTRDPGAEYEYSNLGMGLLGHALARRAGRSYESLVRQRLLEPLGMADTRLVLTTAQRRRFAQGHGADWHPVGPWDFDVLAGAGGWRSTIRDMSKFLAAVVSPPPTPLGRAIASSIEPRRPAGAPTMSIGLGWHVIERGGRRIVWHDGETGGFRSFIATDPVSGANVVMLANSASNNDDIGFHLIDSTVTIRPMPPVRTPVAVAPAVLAWYVGRYELAPGFIVAVTHEDGALFIQATGQPRYRAFASSPTKFFLRVVDAEVHFQVDTDGTAVGLTLHQAGQTVPGKRLPE